MITVVGMGRQRGDLTANGAEAIRRADAVVVKSALTHAAEDVAQIRSDAIFCDDLYQQAQDFEQLNDLIAERLRSFGGKKVVFCVAGDGSDDSTVQRLDGVRVIAGVGFQSAVVGNDMPAGTVFYTAQDICAAKRVLPRPTVVKCIDDKYIASEVQLKLLTAFEPTTRAVFCCGTRTKQIRLDELVRQRFDYRTSLFIAPLPLTDKQVFDYYDCADVMTVLCGENGCPWDRAQTHLTIIKNVIEEAYELADALQKQDGEHTVEELGDLLMQVIFHLEIAHNNGEFEPETVYTALCRKLIDRHPHVFGEIVATNADESLDVWNAQKLKEHKIKNTAQNVADVPRDMSALMRCQKVSSRASKGGYEFESVAQVADKVREELAEFLSAPQSDKQMEGGDLLFACASLLRLSDVDAETALLMSTEKFVRRVTECERLLALRGQRLPDMSPRQFDDLWQEAKSNVG